MKIRPVLSAPAPSPIPTAAEAAANPALVASAPASRPRRGAGALLGAGFLGSLLAPAAVAAAEGAPEEAPPSAVPPSSAEAEAAARAEAARAAVATTVAPILQKAMDEDGRGAFGCVAIDPPVILPENEALDLIEQEFAKAGVKLRDCYELTGYTRTVDDREELHRRLFRDDSEKGDTSAPKRKSERGSWVFDLATEDGSLLLEYLSTADHDKIAGGNSGDFSTVIRYKFPAQVEHFRADLETRTKGNPVTIGLFFDPMARAMAWDETTKKWIGRPGSSLAALPEEEREKLDWEKRNKLLQNDARELLREQVRFFLDWARREGKLPAEPNPAEPARSAKTTQSALEPPVSP